MEIKLVPQIRDRRMEAKKTQTELAKELDMKQSQLSHIETGKYPPSLKLAYKIAFLVNCKVDDLFEAEVIEE